MTSSVLYSGPLYSDFCSVRKTMPGPRLDESWRKRVGDVVISAADGVVTALIDRPLARNAINAAVIDGLDEVMRLACAADARAMVIRGAGGTFCSGADLRELAELRQYPDQLNEFMTRLGDILERIEVAPFPVIAIVEGHAVAGGLELLLACDVVIAATTAKIGDRHLEYGLVPAAGASVRLTNRLPAARARYLLLSADLLTGAEAADWGLITRAVPPGELERFTQLLVGRLASRGVSAAATVKAMAANARERPASEALPRERALFLQHMKSRDAAEGLTAFLERRPPDFTAHEPPPGGSPEKRRDIL
jgi:enoyl-CoA hydratase/carnithine racemase